MLHFDPFNLSLNEKRLVYGLWRGGRYFARSGGSTSSGGTTTTRTKKPTVTPTRPAGLTFGSTLESTIRASQGKPSPWSISRVQSYGGGGVTTPSAGMTSAYAPQSVPAPAPSTSFNNLKTGGKLQFGSKLLAAIKASQGQPSPWNIARAQSSPTAVKEAASVKPLFSTVGIETKPKITSTTSPWNIASARAAIGDAAGSLRTGYKGVLDFGTYEGKKAPTVPLPEEKEEEVAPPQPPAPEPPAPAPPEPFTGIQKMILDALKPTSEEQKLQELIDTELGSLELGLTDVEGRPMPMGLITGAQAQMERRASVRLAPLQRNLQRLQNMREARLKSLETMYGFQEGALTRQFQKEQTDFTNRVALATKGLRYDPVEDKFYRDDSLTAPEDEVEKAKLEEGLRKEFNGLQTVKEFNTIAVQYSRMRDAMNAYLEAKGTPEEMGLANFVDQALVVVFNKILDPGSVVRESEFARTPEGLAYLDRLEAWLPP